MNDRSIACRWCLTWGLPAGRLGRAVALRTAALVLGSMLLSSCTMFSKPQAPVAEQPAVAQEERSQELPLYVPELPEPIARNAFVLQFSDQQVIGQPQRITTRWEDTFSDIARAYGLGYDEMVAANPGIDPWLPGEGTSVLLPTQYLLPDTPREGVVLNVAAKRLFYYPPKVEGEPAWVLTYPIGIGRVAWNTPLGRTRVVAKATDPAWNVPASIRREHAENGSPLPAVVPPGPDNPLGRHVLRLGMTSYLIHGTNKPYGVGMRVSHGCVRLYPENIAQLYGQVPVGETVAIVNQPYLLAWHQGELYLEAHKPMEDDRVAPALRLQALLERAEAESGAFPNMGAEVQLLEVVNAGRGVPVRLLREDVDQVVLRARPVRNVLSSDWIDAADAVY